MIPGLTDSGGIGRKGKMLGFHQKIKELKESFVSKK